MQAHRQFDTRIHGGRNRSALMRAEPSRPRRVRVPALPPAGAVTRQSSDGREADNQLILRLALRF